MPYVKGTITQAISHFRSCHEYFSKSKASQTDENRACGGRTSSPWLNKELNQSNIMPVLLLQNACTLLPSTCRKSAMEISNTIAMSITTRTISLNREQHTVSLSQQLQILSSSTSRSLQTVSNSTL